MSHDGFVSLAGGIDPSVRVSVAACIECAWRVPVDDLEHGLSRVRSHRVRTTSLAPAPPARMRR